MKTTRLLLSVGLLAGGLAACGGGSDSAQEPPLPVVEVPVSAAASPMAYAEFVKAQVASTSETDEPLSLDTFALAPTSEADDPVALN
jgi:ABC-type glycerol-3-phosphate transport system substrate-binding protein